MDRKGLQFSSQNELSLFRIATSDVMTGQVNRIYL